MPRRVRYHERFRRDLAAQVRWLAEHRDPEERATLRAALRAFVRRVTAHPGLGAEVEHREGGSYRVFPIGGPLPYLVWYLIDIADAKAPVSLLMLLHEAQDRERFDPGDFD